MHTVVLVGKQRVALANDKAPKWPVSVADTEFLATRIVNFVKKTNCNFDKIVFVQLACRVRVRRTTTIERMIEGIPVAAAYMKKPNQPIHSCTSPE